MKTYLQILTAVCSIVLSVAAASAQNTPINPTTGVPEAMPAPQPGPRAVALDPASGLPADGTPPFNDNNGTATWIDPSWPEPNIVLPSVNFLNYPLTEVAHQLSERFTNYFDVILPANGPVDPTQYSSSVQLKNVRASEIFSAMNLEFELSKSPLRWELTLNGSRPTVLLRYLPQLAPPAPPTMRKVIYVGDMLDGFPGPNDDTKLGEVVETIYHASDSAGVPRGKIDIFPSGQLLIVSGTPEQMELVEQTLRALKEKAEFDNLHPKK